MNIMERLRCLGISSEVGAKRWDYTSFKEYLLALTRSIDFLLPATDYPRSIELSKEWHLFLNEMRFDGNRRLRERYAAIGGGGSKLFLCLYPKLCEPKKVGREVMELMFYNVEQKHCLCWLGDIHSHPDDGSPRSHSFSACDLYSSVCQEKPRVVQGLVDGDSNYFVFRARESTTIPFSSILFSPDSFAQYWHQCESDGFKMNLRVATRHQLIMYGGKAGKDLVKLQV